jgi:hypothetical protein
MRERETGFSEACIVCGEDLDRGDSRNYFVSATTMVCYECARKHGGVFDSAAERWKVPPNLKSLKSKRPQEE